MIATQVPLCELSPGPGESWIYYPSGEPVRFWRWQHPDGSYSIHDRLTASNKALATDGTWGHPPVESLSTPAEVWRFRFPRKVSAHEALRQSIAAGLYRGMRPTIGPPAQE